MNWRKVLVFILISSFTIQSLSADLRPSESTYEIDPFAASKIAYEYAQAANVDDFMRRLNVHPGAQDREFLTQLESVNSQSSKRLPAIAVSGNKLLLQDAGASVEIEIVDLRRSYFRINGRDLHYNAGIPLSKQLENLFPPSSRKKVRSASTSKSWFERFFFQKAYALGPTGIVGIGMAGSDPAAGNALIAADLAGGAGTFSLLTVGLSIVALAALAGAGYCAFEASNGSERFSQGFLNCITAPLSLLHLNPRDRLYVSKLACYDGGVGLSLESATGIAQNIDFRASGGGLSQVEVSTIQSNDVKDLRITFDPKTKKAEEVSNPIEMRTTPLRSQSEVEKYSRIGDNYEYYRGICQNPTRKMAFDQAIQSGQKMSLDSTAINQGTRKSKLPLPDAGRPSTGMTGGSLASPIR